jgi:predicted O-linked N-acetylglucosamine transferase (SPINDLY family)
MNINQPDVQARLKHQAERYSADIGDNGALSFLREARYGVARAWLGANKEQLPRMVAGPLGRCHEIIMYCGMRNEPLSPEERRFAEKTARPLMDGLDQQSGTYNNMLACMLYLDGYETGVRMTSLHIPPWILPHVTAFLFYRSGFLGNDDKMARYHTLYHRAFQALHATIFDSTKSGAERAQFLQKIVIPLFQQISLVPTYFSDRPLREECVLRAEMLEYAARTMGFATDHAFPPRPAQAKIKLGILRPHFDPSTETYATLPVFEHMDRDRFEIILYTDRVSGSPLERYCASRADCLRNLSAQGANPPAIIRADQLDILFLGSNLSASLQFSLLALHRLARIQVVSFCEPATSGMRHVDYYVAGSLALPPDDAGRFYSEKLAVLEGSGICFAYGPGQTAAIPTIRASLGVPDDAVLYISGANMFKIGKRLVESWTGILAAVPGSVLLLYPFNPNWLQSYPTAVFKRDIHTFFSQAGIASERLIILQPKENFAEIQGILELADVYLDSFPYSGATSIVDALRSGLPVVTVEGRYLRHRQAAAILREMELPDLIATNDEGYRKIAIELGKNPAERHAARDRVRVGAGKPGNFQDSYGYSARMGRLFKELAG